MKFTVLFLFSFSILRGEQPPSQPNISLPQANLVGKTVNHAPDFHIEVRNILESSCISCHGTESQKGGLRLDTLSMAKQGGDSGPALVPGNKSKSLLLERIHLPEDDDEIMPPKGGPLSSEAKEILNRWVESGANWPDGIQLHEISKEELSLRKKSANKTLVSLAAYPPKISLKSKEDFNSIVVVATYADDVTRDVTYESAIEVENPSIINFQDRIAYPKKEERPDWLPGF